MEFNPDRYGGALADLALKLVNMSLDKSALDRYITQGPDTKYQEWLERVWDLIPDTEITADEYEKNEEFFDDGADLIAQAGAHGEFPEPKFAAEVLIKRFKVLKEDDTCKTWLDVAEKVKTRGH
jgi:hypothetical protein